MNNQKTGKMTPGKGIPTAVGVMWVLGALGVFILIRCHHWWFFGDESMPAALSLQVLGFYVAYFGARFPSVVIAGFLIAKTDVRRPYVTTIATVFTFQIVMFGFTLLRWPWVVMPALPASVPMVGEIVNILLLTASAALGVWWPHLYGRLSAGTRRDNHTSEDIVTKRAESSR